MKHLLLSFFIFTAMNPDIVPDKDSFIVIYDQEIVETCARCYHKATCCISSGKDEAYFCDECLVKWLQGMVK